MRRYLALFTSIGLLASISGCNQNDPTAFIRNVQTITIQACAFVPTVETLTAIFSANAALVPMQVANAICQAVTNSTSPTPTEGLRAGASRNGTPVVQVGDKVIPIK